MIKKVMLIPVMGILVILCAIFAGCTSSQTPADNATGAGVTQTPGGTQNPVSAEDPVKAVLSANNNFAFSLYRTLSGENSVDTNLFFSPYSISSVFALVYEGAKGDTASQISSAFYFPENTATLREGYKEMNSALNSGNEGYDLSTANALWAEKTYPFLESYINTAEDYYSANTTNLDFVNRPEESRTEINDWTSGKTNGKITDLIPEGMIDSSTMLVITNAIYFKGEWVKQFDKNETTKSDFTTASGKTVSVDMMKRTDDGAIFGYNETDSLQVLDMPYSGDNGENLSMLVLLPKDGSLKTAEDVLSSGRLENITSSLKEQRVIVGFPKFKLETEYSLPQTLKKMGITDAFTSGADLSGMDGKKDLFISGVVHKAYVDVNEEGTEAAAATGATVSLTAVMNENPVPVFIADHPFIFVIQDDDTGNILFIGRLCNPE
ncbi:serpin B [Methanomicrobium sp. W14]|uniref:serpin family protein n=1 Tax=Methanomicrobium sp. W14 TaxID=2817839 RepID=UPI001AEB10C6|nr:serpin family protein [Methanomicrobium sp. W14]MBP2133955.1 serpin B [Methanomicrobium sp. W14]